MRTFIEMVLNWVRSLTFRQALAVGRIYRDEESRELLLAMVNSPLVLKETIEEYRGLKDHFVVSADDIAGWLGDDDPELRDIKIKKRKLRGPAFRALLNREFKYLKEKASEMLNVKVYWAKGLGYVMDIPGMEDAMKRIRVLRKVLMLLNDINMNRNGIMSVNHGIFAERLDTVVDLGIDLGDLLKDTIHRTIWDHMSIESTLEINELDFHRLSYAQQAEGGAFDRTREDHLDEDGEPIGYDGDRLEELGEGYSFEYRSDILVNPFRFEIPKDGFDESSISDITRCQVWDRTRWSLPLRPYGSENLAYILFDDVPLDKMWNRAQYLPLIGVDFDPRINANRVSDDPSFVTMFSRLVKDRTGLVDLANFLVLNDTEQAYLEEDKDVQKGSALWVSKRIIHYVDLERPIYTRYVVKEWEGKPQVWMVAEFWPFKPYLHVEYQKNFSLAFKVGGGILGVVSKAYQAKVKLPPFCVPAFLIASGQVELKTFSV